MSSPPFLVAACANLGGGLATNVLVRKQGLTRGRRSIGVLGLSIAAAGTVAALFTSHWLGALNTSSQIGSLVASVMFGN